MRATQNIATRPASSDASLATPRPRMRAIVAAAVAAGAAALAYFVFATGLGVTSARAADSCPNAEFRTGPSAKLPDCRAFELVSLANSGGNPPVATNMLNNVEGNFDTKLITADGNSVMFHANGGSFPGYPGSGYSDRFLATRTADGWRTDFIGPTGDQVEAPSYGGMSSDHGYFFVGSGDTGFGDKGTLIDPYRSTPNFADSVSFIRRPDGEFELLGKGSLGEMPNVLRNYISPDAEHIIFTTGPPFFTSPPIVQLEPGAPAGNAQAIYDRSIGGPTHLVSLYPGDIAPAVGVDSWYVGASLEGDLVVYKINDGHAAGPLYVRVDNQESYQASGGPASFAGAFGGHVFYSDIATVDSPANLFSFDTSTQTTTPISNDGTSRFVRVARDGSRVYFISTSQIGGEGTAGEPNLYLWERAGGSTSFIATVSNDDLNGDVNGPEVGGSDNMARWQESFFAGGGRILNRSTPDGTTLVFEAKAQLTAFPTGGNPQIYRYEAENGDLECISCAGTGPATGWARFQSSINTGTRVRPITPFQPVPGVSDDGNTVMFETNADLVPQDINGQVDVYRWTESDGLALISTGRAPSATWIFGATPDASNIVISTPQDLVAEAENGEVRALYSARVNGGFPSPPDLPEPCVGDACLGEPSSPPNVPTVGSSNPSATGNQGRRRGSDRRATKKPRKCKGKKKKCKKRKNKGRAKRNSGGSK